MHEFRRVLIAATLSIFSASAALTEPLVADVKSRIIDLMMESTAAMALQLHGNPAKNAQIALARCREAEKLAARYDQSPYYQGFIADCFGDAERQLNQKKSACAHYVRALQSYRAVPANDGDYKNGAKKIVRTQTAISDLRCDRV